MKTTRTKCIVIVMVAIVVAVCIGMVIKERFDNREPEIYRCVSVDIGTSISVESLVDTGEDAVILPDIILTSSFSDAKVRDEGKNVYVGNVMTQFDVIVRVTDERGKIEDRRITIATQIRD